VTTGLDFAAGSDHSTLKGVKIHGFTNTAVSIANAGMHLSGNYLGPVGGGLPNGDGLQLQSGSDSALIGFFVLHGGNVISGNALNGIRVQGTNHVLENNFIGTDASGTAPLPNGGDGVFISGNATGVIVGGTSFPTINVISGNAGNGVAISGASGNSVAGNEIGVDATASAALPNGGNGIAMINAANNVVDGNQISGNTGDGISIDASSAGNSIVSSVIGLDAGVMSMTSIPNGIHGIEDSGSNTSITFSTISGNTLDGIHLVAASGTTIGGNRIGLDVGEHSAGNGRYGISVGTSQNVHIGGPGLPGLVSNLISGNGSDGINASTATSVSIVHNTIGIDALVFGNGGNGIHLQGTTIANIDSNSITGNGANGILVDGAATGISITGNAIGVNPFHPGGNTGSGVTVAGTSVVSITGNSIDNNGSLGIDLNADGVTPNDSGDGDSGPNGLQNFPVIGSAVSTPSATIAQGTLNSTPGKTFTLEFFSSPAPDPSGHGEGRTPLGTTSVTTDGSGNATFNFTGASTTAGATIAATASSPNGTSEFSNGVTLNAAPTIQFSSATYSVAENGGAATITVTRSGDLTATSTVQYATSNGTATQPADYTAGSGTLTFAPGVGSQTFSIAITTDGLAEVNETVNLTLSIPTAATLGSQSSAVLTITDDDGAAIPTLGEYALLLLALMLAAVAAMKIR
jgi:parallel beta-helix repeat protein